MTHLETDVLVIGAGGAGMYAALAAAEGGARVILVDKNIVGRGGATVMAQMTVAAALAEAEPDQVSLHVEDTLAAGRGLCDETLAELLCGEGPFRIRQMDEWGIGWAREATPRDHVAQVMAPGHSRKRCCYVDFLNTGPAISATLRKRLGKVDAVRRISNLAITAITVADGVAIGATGFDLATGQPVTIAAGATVLAAGGLTKLYRRNSASANMAGDSYALALEAGAELADMEFVQFFPIGHLAPRMVGMDPIMWDPFRYKLGGRLLNGEGVEFMENYGATDSGVYSTPRDLSTYAILKEVDAGRGSPAGGVFLSFRHLGEAAIRAAFGPVVERLAVNGIDLLNTPIEVAPIAHYHMGGIRVDRGMASTLPGLFAAGEAVAGANGANRLSGNAITEALVFGAVAGGAAAKRVAKTPTAWSDAAAAEAVEAIRGRLGRNESDGLAIGPIMRSLQELMWRDVGPFRDAARLTSAIAELRRIRTQDLERIAVPADPRFNLVLMEWFELRASLLAAEAVAVAALARPESRGAQQRDDFIETDASLAQNQILTLGRDGIQGRFERLHAA